MVSCRLCLARQEVSPLCPQYPHYLCSLFLINSLLSAILYLGIFFQLVFRLPWQELFIFSYFLRKKSRKVILISDQLFGRHVNSDYETTPHFLYILPTATWMTDRCMHAGRPFHHVLLFATLWIVAHKAPLSMGILQARILERVAMSFSRGSFRPRDQTRISYVSSIGRWALYH